MRSPFAQTLGILGIVLLSASLARGQQAVRVRGQLQVESRIPRGPWLVELVSEEGGRAAECAQASPTGDFEFGNVVPGAYQLVVTSHRGDVVHQQRIDIRQDSFFTVHVRDEASVSDIPGPVSVRQLQRQIPGAAQKELHKGQQFFAKADYPQALSHLQKAIDRYPDYPEAHNDLGVCYARMHEPQNALHEFQKACELDPDSAAANGNLAAAFLQSGQYADAERTARRALKADPFREFSHLVLGLSLTLAHREGTEAVQSLRRAAAHFPEARLALADILHRCGHQGEAAEELRLYLQSPLADRHRQFVESWLARLQKPEKAQDSPAAP